MPCNCDESFDLLDLLEKFNPVLSKVSRPILREKESYPADSETSVQHQARMLGVVHKGFGTYGPKNGEPEFINKDGKLVPIKGHHPAVNKWKKSGSPEEVPDDAPPPMPPARMNEPTIYSVLGPYPPGTEDEKATADWINRGNRIYEKMKAAKSSGNKTRYEIELVNAMEWLQSAEIVRTKKGYRADIWAGYGVARDAPKSGRFSDGTKISDFVALLEKEGGNLSRRQVETQAGTNLPLALQRVIENLGIENNSTVSERNKPSFKKITEGGRAVGFEVHLTGGKKITSNVDANFPSYASQQLYVAAGWTVEKIRKQSGWKKLYDSTFKKMSAKDKLAIETNRKAKKSFEEYIDSLWDQKVLENIQISVMAEFGFDDKGSLKGTILTPSTRIPMIEKCIQEIMTSPQIRGLSKEKRDELASQMKRLKGAENRASAVHAVKDIINVVSNDKNRAQNLKGAPYFAETLAVIVALADGYDVFVPSTPNFPVGDFIGYRVDDAGNIVNFEYGSVKLEKGAAAGILGRIFMSSFRGFTSRTGKYHNPSEIKSSLLEYSEGARQPWDDRLVASARNDELASEYQDVLLAAVGVVPQNEAEAASYLKQIRECMRKKQIWSLGMGNCKTKPTTYPSCAQTNECKKAWELFWERGGMLSLIANTLLACEGYSTWRANKMRGIDFYDGRCGKEGELHSGIQYQWYKSDDKKSPCCKPDSGFSAAVEPLKIEQK